MGDKRKFRGRKYWNKRRITDKRREELGLNAVTLPKIADNNSAMKVAKELVDSGDVNPMEIDALRLL